MCEGLPLSSYPNSAEDEDEEEEEEVKRERERDRDKGRGESEEGRSRDPPITSADLTAVAQRFSSRIGAGFVSAAGGDFKARRRRGGRGRRIRI